MTKDTRWGLRRIATLAMPALLVGVMAGCDVDNFLDVEDPEVASPGSVRDPAALPVVYAGAVRDFTLAYSGTGSTGGGGNNDSQITLSGLFTDELQHTGTFPTREEIDRRAIPTTGGHGTSSNGTLADAYRNLHKARRAAEQAEDLYAAAEAEDSAERSALSSFAGYTYIFFGENYCEGVPYSSIDLDGTVTDGEATTMEETFDLAINAFDKAITIATTAGDEDTEYLARVGKARALLNQGHADQAAAEVSEIPSEWAYNLEHSDNSTGENNGVWTYTISAGRYGVADGEGINGLDWSNDERSPTIVDPGDAFDDDIETFITQNKYPSRDAEVTLADGREARLIEAEAAIGTGDFIGYINEARAVDGLAPLTDPGSEDAQIELLFQERGHALWLTSHRLGDLRRMIRDYGFEADEVFPTGDYFRDGLEYGDDVNFPIYVDEVNNPNFTGCLNRDA